MYPLILFHHFEICFSNTGCIAPMCQSAFLHETSVLNHIFVALRQGLSVSYGSYISLASAPT